MTPRPTSEATPVRPTVLRGGRWPTRLSGAHLLVVAAGVLAVLANLAVLRSVDDRVPVVVAREDLEAGTTVGPGLFTTALVDAPPEILAGLVPGSELETLTGSILTRPVAASEVLRRSDLVAAAAPGGLLAMSIPVDPARAVGGRLVVGDRVDVVRVVDGVATFVATDLEVLSVADLDRGALGAQRGFFVVVAVDRAEALALAETIAGSGFEVVSSTGAEGPG